MLLIPAIDLKDGKCVRLRQGRMEDDTVFSDDPVAMATQWVEQGGRRLHLVDLNGAFAGKPVNGDVVKDIAKKYPELPIQIGGGIRDANIIEAYLSAGVNDLIIGTKAVKEPEFVREMCKQFSGHIIVGLDAKDGWVATDGWANVTDINVIDLAKQFESDGVNAIVYTDINRDGMMQGVNIEATVRLAKAVTIPIIASGGVTDIEDVKQLCAVANCGVSEKGQHRIMGAITGRAIYEGTLDLNAGQELADKLSAENAGV